VTNSLDNKTALVTGASRGLGRAISESLAAEGVQVVLVARSVDELDEVASAIRRTGGVAIVSQADVSDPAALEQLVGRSIEAVGGVDILINNAAVVWPLGPSVSISGLQWSEAIQTNLMAPARLTFALLPGMTERSWGRVVNISAGVASRPYSMIGGNAYATSKAALEAHTINLASEFANTGVTFNCFRPGRLDTAMQNWIRSQSPAEIGPELHERFSKWHQQGKLGDPRQSARSLLSHLESSVTGEIWNA
jgi:NAD(P)-dependent dehydrogenase (short-subunit alcohol dehydrogenase family)